MHYYILKQIIRLKNSLWTHQWIYQKKLAHMEPLGVRFQSSTEWHQPDLYRIYNEVLERILMGSPSIEHIVGKTVGQFWSERSACAALGLQSETYWSERSACAALGLQAET